MRTLATTGTIDRASMIDDDLPSFNAGVLAAASPATSETIPGAVRSKLAITPVQIRDPEAVKQWHLGLMGDVEAVWTDFTGNGVSVGVYDSGVQYEHWDLAANYDASKHVVVEGKVYDGDFHPQSGPHGTAVAGIIAASRNGRDTVGIAHGSTITGVNIFNPYSEDGAKPGIFVNAPDKSKFYSAMRQADQFDVVNHSWGGFSAYGSFASRNVEGGHNWSVTQTIAHIAEFGRGGLGTVSVSAAGNTIIRGVGSLDDQTSSWKSDRRVINVGAYRGSDGSSTFYSTHGAHLLISAPSLELAAFDNFPGVVTTDLLGRAGYNFRNGPGVATDYTDIFGGTSAAAPMVTGVVALMLDANEGLGWRDVNNILAASAKMPVAFETGQTFATALSDRPIDGVVKGKDYILNSSSFKLGGGEASWNGGRMHFSTDYGYGAVDAHAAVRMAEVWSLFGAAKTSGNERVSDTGRIDVDIVPPNNGPVDATKAFNDFVGKPASVEIAMAGNVAVEHVDLTIHFDAELFGLAGVLSAVRFKVTAPDGTSAFVDTLHSNAGTTEGAQQFTFGLAAFRGVQSGGTWKIDFEGFIDQFATKTTITGVRLQAFGAEVSVDDVHTFTDEFFTMARIAGEAGRKVLSDVDGGMDWINAAAVTADINLSLNAGQGTTFDGVRAFTIARATQIENAVTGDGNDRLIGSRVDNKLYGMRGDDWLNGGAGNDTLYGGQGRDVFAFDTTGVSGKDVVLDWSAGDRIATSKALRGADAGGLVTLGANAMILLDGTLSGDTAELSRQGGAVLQALGKQDGYWWYGFVSGGSADARDGAIREAALGGMADATIVATHAAATFEATTLTGATDKAFYLYDAMGDAMAGGVQITA